MKLSDLTTVDLFETFGLAIILITIVKIVYFLYLAIGISNVKFEIEQTNKKIDEMSEKQIELLERIAKALEQEPEPYVIESDDEKH